MELIFSRGYETFCAIPEKGGMKHFPKAKGTVFSVVGYEIFPRIIKKTLQQGRQVKK